MTNDMIIDTDDFDIFSQLDGLEAVEPTKAAPAKKGKEPVEDVETDVDTADGDDADDDGDEVIDFDQIDDDSEEGDSEEESEESEEEESEEDDSEEESEEESEESDDDSDEEEVDYEGYEVTLPSGETIKLSDAVAGYKAAGELKEEREAFESARQDFEEKSKDLQNFLSLAKLEAEKVVEDYKDFDWAELSRTDPQAYVENREFLDKYKTRLKEIKTAFTKLEEERVAKEEEQMQAKARECVQELQKDIPGWNKELYSNLMQFAVDNGMPEETIRTAVDPSVFKLLHKAYQFDKGKAVAKAKISRVGGAPKKVVKSAPKAVVQKPSKRATIEKKIASGKMSDKDMGAFFDILED